MMTDTNSKMKSGVYIIDCSLDQRFYVGKSKNVLNRFSEHRSRLRHGLHRCHRLQQAWDKYGEAAFAFRLVARVHIDALEQVEQVWIQAHFAAGMLFNTVDLSVPFGVRRAQKISAAQKAIWADPTKRAKLAAKIRHAQNKPEAKARMRAAQLLTQNRPEVKVQHSATMKRRMADPAIRAIYVANAKLGREARRLMPGNAGEANPWAKLTNVIVLGIRASTEPPAEIAKNLSIHVSLVNKIRRGDAWKHLLGVS